MNLPNIKHIYQEMAAKLPSVVHCSQCGREQAVDPAKCFQKGWPECCGYTMSLERWKEAAK
jgi:hypothetical protein